MTHAPSNLVLRVVIKKGATGKRRWCGDRVFDLWQNRFIWQIESYPARQRIVSRRE